jgi:2-oxoglutarate dehydrogenase E1 component
MDRDLRHFDFLGAGDPSALDELFGRGSECGPGRTAWYRFGWLAADLDPLKLANRQIHPDLAEAREAMDAAETARLDALWCGTTGWEIGHLQDPERAAWLVAAIEDGWAPPQELRNASLDLIARAETLEARFAKRLPTVKIFGLSGSESYLVAIDAAIRESGAKTIVVGGMHRGRLTQMALSFEKPLVRCIAECMGTPDLPKQFGASSDVPYHLGWEGTRADGIHMWIAPHPSHLSIVPALTLGRAYSMARETGEAPLPLLLHTDAAFAGQGVNMELLQLSALRHYFVGGTIHLVLNNQLGFTTNPEEGRTARACTDIAKLIEAPIIHVNGDDPDAVLAALRVAARYRNYFGADVVVDLITYRRRGHNEIEEARFTQPLQYKKIDALRPLSARYSEACYANATDLSAFRADIDEAFTAAETWAPNSPEMAPGFAPDIEARLCDPVATGVDPDRLRALGAAMSSAPEGMTLHPKVLHFLDKRRAAFEKEEGIDWATAEALAMAVAVDEGLPVRFCGQDSVRGAFTQRHLALHDQKTGAVHSVIGAFGGDVEVFNTPLIENAVLGFEYGFSVGDRRVQHIWEAQFGDFLNVCQSTFDQFVTGGEDRWLLTSRLTMLLPHGMDGGGPDHSTAHPERVLARCARGNICVINASTPANYFHALRRQVVRQVAKPLVVFTPKFLLRHSACRSALVDFGPGTGFQTVIAEKIVRVKRVVLCSGKMYFLLDAARKELGLDQQVALVRLEQLYPFPTEAVTAALKPYGEADLVWAQEEPENLGPFTWLDRQLEAAAGRRVRLISRPAAPSPAVGWKIWHDKEQWAVIAGALSLEDTL